MQIDYIDCISYMYNIDYKSNYVDFIDYNEY